MSSFLKKYREILLYGVFGCGATVINIVSFYVLHNLFGMQMMAANVAAWCFAFVFAFITNKLFVFESREWGGSKAVREALGFCCERVGTLFLDAFLMWLLIVRLCWNSLYSKVVVNLIVIVVNYVVSKYVVFKE